MLAMEMAALKTACSTCSLRELCLPVGLSRSEIEALDQLVYVRKRIAGGESLFLAGDPFRSLYAVRSGFFKTRVTTADGRDQVTGFLMAGELLGIDGIGAGQHACDAVALEDGEVCVIPYSRLEEMAHRFEPLQQHFHKVMSREIVRDHGVMLMLGSLRAEEKLAAFLLNLSQRSAARGYPARDLVLRMTRAEIGSFLGLKLETVSRLFTRFQAEGLLAVRQKNVRIADETALQRRAGLNC
jgi:CRP/FNR family transcriptional regulator